MVIYPIIDNVDGDGNQLVNWMAEIKRDTREKNDWNQAGNIAEFYPIYRDWRVDRLNVAELIRTADQILEYPMVEGPGEPLDFRPGDARGRRRPSDVPARLQRRRAGRDR
jgi:hypothetical protein